ncbi:protein tyrosine phosphatase type IVA 3 isoform X1 [Lemur catta]|uniref:protein tyrosine phosphatase type IVA 3 isoform X1 n=1 Tax=Lemur catta TaxID=9447 RepID=UPI001E2687B8|nr:protein tyrosine phosphatase type IVA 3 isoform X1 [Lemur catta]
MSLWNGPQQPEPWSQLCGVHPSLVARGSPGAGFPSRAGAGSEASPVCSRPASLCLGLCLFSSVRRTPSSLPFFEGPILTELCSGVWGLGTQTSMRQPSCVPPWRTRPLGPADLKPLRLPRTRRRRDCDPRAKVQGDGVEDWPFDDGAPPPGKVVEDWLSLLKSKFCEDPGSCVAVHCVAGLGRAPVLVALALIESGMKYEDAIQFIRQKRRGAINSKQLTYLEKYRPKQRLRFKDPHTHKTKCCVM